jgi:Fur family ferric uptake transcriptional regulator
MRMTSQRKKILDVLHQHDLPMTCDDIHMMIHDDKLNLSTVYRSLEKFYEDHQVFKTIINQKQYYYTGHHHHFLVCIGCEKMIPVGCHIEGKEKAIGQPYGFQVTHHDMTLYGYCEHCQTH